jgi:hypothetical protein
VPIGPVVLSCRTALLHFACPPSIGTSQTLLHLRCTIISKTLLAFFNAGQNCLPLQTTLAASCSLDVLLHLEMYVKAFRLSMSTIYAK